MFLKFKASGRLTVRCNFISTLSYPLCIVIHRSLTLFSGEVTMMLRSLIVLDNEAIFIENSLYSKQIWYRVTLFTLT